MFYEPAKRDRDRLPHNPLKAIVTPRPIGWISSLAPDGTANLAPYSFFNLVSEAPDVVAFSSDGRKHSVENIEATGEFVCNLATLPLIEQVNFDLQAGRARMKASSSSPGWSAPARIW